jgi:hypothetical protein
MNKHSTTKELLEPLFSVQPVWRLYSEHKLETPVIWESAGELVSSKAVTNQ